MTTLATTKQDHEIDVAVFDNSGGGVGNHRTRIGNNGSGAITSSGIGPRRPARLRFRDRHLEVARATLAEATDRINILD